MSQTLLHIDLVNIHGHHEVQEWLPWDEVLSNQLHLMDVSLLSSVVNGWRALRTATLIGQSKSPHVLGQQHAVDMFRQHVSRIISTQNFGECKILLPQPILDPQVGSG